MTKEAKVSAYEKRAIEVKKNLTKALDVPCPICGHLTVLADLARELSIDKASLWRFVHTRVVVMEPSLKKIEKWLEGR